MRRAFWPLFALLFLVACGVPQLPARQASDPAAAPGAAGGATARATSAAATATALPAITATDPARLCQLAVPSAFVEDSPGSGYFPARDRTGFIAIDAPDRAGGANTFDQAIATVLANLKTLPPEYVETTVVRAPGSLRVEFTAAPEGRAGRGVAYFKDLAPFVCGGTLFLTADSPLPFDATLGGLTGTLQVVRGAKPLPTLTPVPPTPTPRPPTPTPHPALTKAPYGLSIPPGSVLLDEYDNFAIYLSPFDTEAETRTWFEREWAALGFVYAADYIEQGYTFRVFRKGLRVACYTTVRESNLIGFAICAAAK